MVKLQKSVGDDNTLVLGIEAAQTAAGIDLRQIDDIPRLYIFWPGGDVDDYGPEDVTNCSFGRHLEARGDARTYDIVRGGQAFYHKIVTDLREWNISADMWEGFKLETVTELPK